MPHYTPKYIQAPVLALDLAPSALRALLYQPGKADTEAAVFHLPLPQKASPQSAAVPDYDPQFWSSLCMALGLPKPEICLVAAVENGHTPGHDGHTARNAALRRLFIPEGVLDLRLDSLMQEAPDPACLRLSVIRRMTGFPVLDAAQAFILGLSVLPEIAERSYRQGVTLLHAHRGGLLAALLFQGRVHGFLRLPSGAGTSSTSSCAFPSDLPELLKDFRLGWLPPEALTTSGGFVCYSAELPGEAEGFAPIFAAGECAEGLQGQARILGEACLGLYNNCRGLLHGYELWLGRARP